MSMTSSESVRIEWQRRRMEMDPRTLFTWMIILLILVIILTKASSVFSLLLIQLTLTIRTLSRKRMQILLLTLIFPSSFILILNLLLFNLILHQSLILVGKFWIVVFGFTWFYSKVDPDEFTQILESLKIPPLLAWQFGMAYRQVPFLFKKTREIYELQVARGIPLDQGMVKAARHLPSLIIPTIIQAMEAARKVSEAMISRGWQPHIKSTRISQLKFKRKDVVILLLMLLIGLTPWISEQFLELPI